MVFSLLKLELTFKIIKVQIINIDLVIYTGIYYIKYFFYVKYGNFFKLILPYRGKKMSHLQGEKIMRHFTSNLYCQKIIQQLSIMFLGGKYNPVSYNVL